MASHGMCTPHEKHQTCGTCRHPKMSKTRKHVEHSPLPQQKNAATNNG